MTKILIVEDEKPISKLIEMSLTSAGYACTCVYDGMAAADLLEEHRYDLVLLDIMLPGASGYELMDYIRPMDIPVIFLTAKTSVADRVKGLRLGADDYLGKPFEIIELLARVESVLRRTGRGAHVLTAFDVQVEPVSRTVLQNGSPVALAPREFDLLVFLIRNRGIVLHRDVIYERVWGGESETDTRVLDLNIQRLRKKLGWSKHIKTVYRLGYLLEGAG